MNAVNAEIEAREGAKGVSRYEVLGMVALPNLLQIRSEIFKWLFGMICGRFWLIRFGWECWFEVSDDDSVKKACLYNYVITDVAGQLD